MEVSDFDYYLPPELIAQHPMEPRDQARLLVLNKDNGEIVHSRFFQLPTFLHAGDTLVFNDTKVIPARLIGSRPTGGRAEVFLLRRLSEDTWETLVRPAKRLRPGGKVIFSDDLSCDITAATTAAGGRIVRFHFEGIFEQILDRLGQMPLPPYIKEPLADPDSYQTVYARERGSAAAPTAGLHFTTALMRKLSEQGINLAYITLHIGLGTFRPVKVQRVEEHIMHSEFYTVDEHTASLINRTRASGHRIISVGTTVTRTLETVGRGGEVQAGSGWTDIFIYPGYKFQVIDALITNFHLPQSTLLMLVCALAGHNHIMAAYQEAIARRYRFYSFGDAMFIC